MTARNIVETDVVVVGGGLSGLAAALTMKEAGRAFVLVEGKDKLGGRVRTEASGFGPVDVGAEFIGPSQRHVTHFVRRFGVPTFSTYLPTSKRWLYLDAAGAVSAYDSMQFPGGAATVAAIGELDELAFLVRPYIDRPETLPGFLKRFDAITIAQWQPASGAMSAATQEAFHASVRAVLSIEPGEASMLYLLHYAAAAGGFSVLIDATGAGGGAQDLRFVNGSGDLVRAFGAALDNASVALGDPVARVENGARRVTVTTQQGTVYHAKRMISAIGPWAFARCHNTPIEMEFAPKGAHATAARRAWRERKKLCRGMHHGLSIKSFVRFKTPFWRDANLVGRALCASAANQPVAWTVDDSWERPESVGPAARFSMMAFMAGDGAHALARSPMAARQAAVLAQLTALFGPKVGAEFIDYVDQPMAGPTGVLAPGVLSSVGAALRRPVGRIHWAATESALDWCGYMDGAIQAGMRAATEVL